MEGRQGGSPDDGGEHDPLEEPAHARDLLLVIGSNPAVGPLVHRLRVDVGDGPEPRVHVVAPALTETAFAHAAGSVDDAMAAARERLEGVLDRLRDEFRSVDGDVGDADPLLAIGDALRARSFDEVLIVTTASEDEAAWLEDDVFERARTAFDVPFTHVELSQAGEIAEHERSAPGADDPPPAELGVPVGQVPERSITLRDGLGMLVAVVGTIALILLAAECLGDEPNSAGCIARAMIAGGVGLINIAHVVGLTLFVAADYHGPWERFFARASLFGTPVAILISWMISV